jgi:hypothetical protein
MHDLKSFQPNTPRPWGPTYEEMASAARAAFPGVPLGGGMLSFFTELNRKRPPQGVFDFITHTACPIVHSADDISVMETLESLPWIIASTRAMIGTSPYHMGPTSIPCRDNPYGAKVAANPDNGRVCLSDMDPRQRGLFAAAWSLGLVAAAAKGKLDAVSLGAVTGAQGLIYRKSAICSQALMAAMQQSILSITSWQALGAPAVQDTLKQKVALPEKLQRSPINQRPVRCCGLPT